MTERKMARIVSVDSTVKHPNADSLDIVTVGGWRCVTKLGEFKQGDLAVYLEIDSWVPHIIAPFLSKGNEPREYNGVKGERLRTAKLRGQVSQGLLMPLTVLPRSLGFEMPLTVLPRSLGFEFSKVNGSAVGEDVSHWLGVQKWEAPIPAQLAGQVVGTFPSWGKRTDAERCQNLSNEIAEAYNNDIKFEVTIKLDGTSMSAGVSPDGEFHVCSRNLSLNLDQIGNTYVDVAKMYDLENKMKALNRPLMISGEIIGEGIQKNQEKIKNQEFFVFNIWDPIRSEYLSRDERMSIVTQLGLKHAPVLHQSVTLRELGLEKIEQLLKFAEGPSLNAASREGVVFKTIDGTFMFKSISNEWLIRNE
jgi:RNA ligase (TIGR02306 family)